MQINRLLEIIYILFDKKTVTAKKLSEEFGVSQRTIYRDVDALSAAGIPIYANKGKGGGIGLLDGFVLNKSMLTEKEQNDILSSLQSLKALNVTDVDPVLRKLSIIFNLSLIKCESKEQAQNAPAPFTTYSFFNEGKFVTNEILSESSFIKFLQEKGF